MKINLNDNVGDLAVGMDLFATTFAVFFVIMSLGLISGNGSESNGDSPTQITFIVEDDQTTNLDYRLQIGNKDLCSIGGCNPFDKCLALSDEKREPLIVFCDDLQPSTKSTLFNQGRNGPANAKISIKKIFGSQVCSDSVLWIDIVGKGKGKEVFHENCD